MGHSLSNPASSPARILVFLVALLLATVVTGPSGAVAGLEIPRCFGRRATIVGDNRPNRMAGTPRPDVIVSGGGSDIVFGLGGSDLICGGSGSDEVYGGGGNDKLGGQTGNDYLAGSEGHDLMIGGEGSRDLALFHGAPTSVAVDLRMGTARGWGEDHLRGIEDVSGTRHSDELVGDGHRNFLFGQAGNDRIDGLAENDFLFGGTGDDALVGGGGFDAADYTLSNSGVVINLGNGTAAGEGQDKLSGIEDAWGSTHNDNLIGDSSANHLYGWDGPDSLDGRGGNDLIVPGVGDDTVEGGGGADFVDYFFGKLSDFLAANPVNVNLTRGVATGSGTDSLMGIENISGTNRNDVLTGSEGANAIFGYNGDDELYGLAGNDWVDGGSGNDFLSGGAGMDWCTTGESFEACESSQPPDDGFLLEARSESSAPSWLLPRSELENPRRVRR
jgi:Ca2+-binding RTX toxin-like protein